MRLVIAAIRNKVNPSSEIPSTHSDSDYVRHRHCLLLICALKEWIFKKADSPNDDFIHHYTLVCIFYGPSFHTTFIFYTHKSVICEIYKKSKHRVVYSILKHFVSKNLNDIDILLFSKNPLF